MTASTPPLTFKYNAKKIRDLSKEDQKQFAYLTPIKPVARSKAGNLIWQCRCICGTLCEVAGTSLTRPDGHQGRQYSCGCKSKDHCTTHGKSHSREYVLWVGAKQRAKKLNLPFNIDMEDVVIPDKCPCLGIDIVPGEDGGLCNSPSLDRIYPSLGYVKGNVWVISFQANRIKNDSSPQELSAVASAVAEKIKSIN